MRRLPMKFLLAIAVGFMTVTLFSARLNAADPSGCLLPEHQFHQRVTAKFPAPGMELFSAGNRGDWAEVIQQATVHIENRQNDADTRRNAYIWRIYAHFCNGDKESGLADFKIATDTLVQTRAHWVDMASVFYACAQSDDAGFQESGLIAEGIAICTNALNAEIEEETDKIALARLYVIRGILHIFEKNDEQAIDDLQQGYEPNDRRFTEGFEMIPGVLSLTASMNAVPPDSERIISLATHCIDSPKTPEDLLAHAHYWRSHAHAHLGNLDQAQTDLDRSIELKPTAHAFESRATFHYFKNEIDKAFDDLNESLLLQPTGTAYVSRGYLYGEMGNTDAALNDYTNAIIQDPYNISARLQRADILSQKGDWHGAIADYDNMLQTYPEQEAGPLLYLRGAAYRRINECEKAWSDFNEAVRLESDEWHGRNNRVNLGYIICFHSAPPLELRREIIDTIIADTTALLEADDAQMDKMEAQMDAHLFRGIFYWHDEQYDKALADFDAIIKEKGETAPMTRLRRALVQLRLAEKEDGKERLERALADAEAVIQTDAKCGEAYFCRAKVLEAMDEPDKAKADFDQAQQLGFDGNENALFVLEYKIIEN